ncbi:MAG: hypothetical protein I8H75_01535 [Myxococcaceae bacterium]|nr:hypothetical protein [Myxococcaceae bacterium]MBH2006021.1 hypothetical protein [Myxococcaceae bacterium]
MKRRDYFYVLADRIQQNLLAGERFTAWYSGEDSDFVRINQACIRQAGCVSQRFLSLCLVAEGKQVRATFGLTGELERDVEQLGLQLKQQREMIPVLPRDPFLLISDANHSSESSPESQLGNTQTAISEILTFARNLDLVGIYAQGSIDRGFASSSGQRNWMSKSSFNFDFSVYHEKDKAVKASYAGFLFDPKHFEQELVEVQEKLHILKLPSQTLSPGRYRAYFTPSALSDLIGMLGWGGLSERSLQTKHSCLVKMRDQGFKLSSKLSISEATAQGIGPLFQSEGFIKPAEIPLIREGRLVGSLVSPRTAQEYGLRTNGASFEESPEAYSVAPGELFRANVLQELGTGIFVGNLWYLNFSDRSSARITGMTRFATFWVEKGQIVAPLSVMRFDDCLYDLLGSNLLAFTQERDFILDAQTYEQRSTASAHMPGALVQDFHLTL